MKETVDNKTIEQYIQKLVASYGIYPIVSEKALRIQFEHNLYAECVLGIMRKMGLTNTVKVTCYADYKYPCPTSAARIALVQPFPQIGTPMFNRMRIQVDIKESVKKNFHAFVAAIAHELSHVVMHGTAHELHKSEIATDLCALVFGFSDFVTKGKTLHAWSVLGTQTMEIGYLSTSQLHHAIGYIEQLRKQGVTKQKQPVKENKVFFDKFKNLFDDVFNGLFK